MPKQNILPTSLAKNILPAIGHNANVEDVGDTMIHVRLFNAYGCGTWFIAEFDGEDECFGAVDLGMTSKPEWGYFSLAELRAQNAFIGRREIHGLQAIERDTSFRPTLYKDI